MARFAYVGDRAGTTLFGVKFQRGVAAEVLELRAIGKLSNNHEFVLVVDGVEVSQAAPVMEPPKRRGRPPKVK